MAVIEPRKPFRERLKVEGRWEAYRQWEAKLRHAGSSKLQISELAATTWAPLPPGEGTPPGMSPPDASPDEHDGAAAPAGKAPKKQSIRLAQFKDKKSTDARTDVEWVFQHVAVDDVTADMAPSPGAWGLLNLVRENPSFQITFYSQIWAKLLPTRSQLEKLDNKRDDGSSIDELISDVLAQSPEDG